MTLVLGIYTGTQYLHRHLACYTWYMIYDYGTRYLHRHLACYTWYRLRHSAFTLALGIYTGTWYLKPIPQHLIFRHQYSIYVILDTCSWHPVYDMLSCGISTLTWHCDPWPNTTTLHLYYMTYSWLSLLRGLGMTIILLPDIWYSWTPVLLYSWTPEIGRLLTLLLMLYSCWSP